jgi:hypothetical protein
MSTDGAKSPRYHNAGGHHFTTQLTSRVLSPRLSSPGPDSPREHTFPTSFSDLASRSDDDSDIEVTSHYLSETSTSTDCSPLPSPLTSPVVGLHVGLTPINGKHIFRNIDSLKGRNADDGTATGGEMTPQTQYFCE